MIVCRDNKWFGNVSPEKFTCNPRCDGDTLAEPENGHWECTDKYFEHSRETVKDYNCVLKCKDGYEPKQDTQATCDIASVSQKGPGSKWTVLSQSGSSWVKVDGPEEFN